MKSKDYQEEINITTNTNYLNEKALKSEDKLSTTIFELTFTIFLSSIITQLIIYVESSFNLLWVIPNIVLLFAVLIFLLQKFNKKLSIKSFLVIVFVIIGIIISI